MAAWLRADPVDWGIRIAIVFLVIGAIAAIYIQGESRGWWNQGTAPTAAPSRPAMSGQAPTPGPSGSGEAAMSGGYQVGPDGVLVRPAEHAASTYTLPELPQAATENTERGAEAAAEHYLALLVYAWNTGDTTPLADMSDPTSDFASTYISDIDQRYSNGWTYGLTSKITYVLRVEPVPANGADIPEGSVLTKFRIESYDGTVCSNQKITVASAPYESTLSLLMTWSNGRWRETQGRVVGDNE